MSQAIDIYLKYCAMKAHFGKGDYDYVKFGGKSKVSRESFWKRKDRYFFVKIGRKYDAYLIESIDDYLLANFIVENKGWVGNFSDENYYKWKDRMSRLTEIFENEVTPLLENFKTEGKHLFAVPESSHPKLLKEYLGKRISLETMIILDKLMDYGSKWDKQLNDDVVWPKTKKLIDDYKKFLTFEEKECKMILINLTKVE
tara:strand:- start:1373 stop:1972 length:600 start_codon:yes stop_codon:yes gene_type:complete